MLAPCPRPALSAPHLPRPFDSVTLMVLAAGGMTMRAGYRSSVDIDWAGFDPWRVQAVRHRLVEHPLLQPDPLIDLGKRLERQGRVRTHSNDAEPGTPFNAAPRLHPHRRPAGETLQRIRSAVERIGLHMSSRHIAPFRQVLDELKPRIDRVRSRHVLPRWLDLRHLAEPR